MGLSRSQIILLKRAQREAGIDDAEYREMLGRLFGFSSSKDQAWTDGQLDSILKYFEAIFWYKVDTREPVFPHHSNPVFSSRGYWQKKNRLESTSRDRFSEMEINLEIRKVEAELEELGFGAHYCQAIKRNVGSTLVHYLAALRRTLAYKRKKYQTIEQPF